MRKIIGSMVLIVIMILALSGCSSNNSKNSIIQDAASNFSQTVNNNKEDLTYHSELSHYGLKLKDNDKLEWAEDPSVSGADFSITLNAEEFIKAGLDITKVESSYFEYFKDPDTNIEKLIYKYNINDEKASYKNSDEAFQNLISLIPNQIESIKNDGYVLNFDKGFQLHWNSDDRVNKDLAFIIVADDLIKAGLDIDKLDVWKVLKNKDPNDKQVKLLKVHYLK